MTYKAVGFDYGGVINGLPGTVFNQRFSEITGVSEDAYKQAYFAHNKEFNRGNISVDELWQKVLSDLDKVDKFDEVIALRDEFHQDRINTEVLGLVDELRTNGFKVGLLSNNDVENANKMKSLGINTHFDVFHVSALTGLVKPEPGAFEHLAEDLGVTINEMAFVDDAEKSLSTAQECGFTPVLFTSYENLKKQLADLGIL